MFKELVAQSSIDIADPNAPDTVEDTGSPYNVVGEKYGKMLAALEEIEPTDPKFIQALLDMKMRPDTLERMADDALDVAYPRVDDPVFEERLENLGTESRPAREVAWRLAQLVLSVKEDKAKFERIENNLATYDGPLSVLNVHVQWFLNHPKRINTEEKKTKEKAEYLATMDREELFSLLDSIVTPVLNEDMTIFNAIAAIFAKYEDVRLGYRTESRLRESDGSISLNNSSPTLMMKAPLS
ncbi:hypothetical protein FB451DRAFT_1408452 [Mycena latifolia]|nr:hypothetical protein FB451DRAFT_1408452 [Mycena latifolia]